MREASVALLKQSVWSQRSGWAGWLILHDAAQKMELPRERRVHRRSRRGGGGGEFRLERCGLRRSPPATDALRRRQRTLCAGASALGELREDAGEEAGGEAERHEIAEIGRELDDRPGERAQRVLERVWRHASRNRRPGESSMATAARARMRRAASRKLSTIKGSSSATPPVTSSNARLLSGPPLRNDKAAAHNGCQPSSRQSSATGATTMSAIAAW